MNIADKLYVSIVYQLSIDSGQEVDSSSEWSPLCFITGHGQIIPGLEKALIGRAVGDSTQIILEPEEAYGEVNEELFQDIPRSQFPDEAEVKPGSSFQVCGPQGSIVLTVTKVNDNDTVTVDLNHPMAGKRLHFDVKVIEVREPTDTELSQLSTGCGCSSGHSESAECGSNGKCGSSGKCISGRKCG